MIKRLVLGGAGLLMLLGLCFGRDACSYVATTVGWFHQSVRDSVPVEFELDRARRMIAALNPEIEKNLRKIATEEVEVKKLADRLALAEQQLAKSERDILRLKTDLERGEPTYVYANVAYTAEQVERDLERRFERHKVKEATVEKLRGILQARQRALAAAREKLTAMRAAQRQLEVDVENLEARLQMVQVAQATSNFNFDDSQLARTRQLIERIGTRIDVAERLVQAEHDYPDQIPLEEPSAEDILQEVARHFGWDRTPEAEHVVVE